MPCACWHRVPGCLRVACSHVVFGGVGCSLVCGCRVVGFLVGCCRKLGAGFGRKLCRELGCEFGRFAGFVGLERRFVGRFVRFAGAG